MASSIPTFATLISVDRFRELVNKHFEKEINENELYDPHDIQRFNEVDEYTLMYIQHGQFGPDFDADRALQIFNISMSWRKSHNVYDVSTNEFPADYFDRNGIYFKNRDMSNYPLLHFDVRTFKKGQEDNETVKRFITYNFERHIRRHPGEKIVILFDLSETGLRNLDLDLVKFIISSVQIGYPGLLAYMMIYKMPFILQAVWRLIRSWLPAEAEQFIKFVDAKSITQYVQPDQLSIAMGGNDTTNYVHLHDPINEAVEDSMNASLKKKVTFADSNSLDLPLSSSPTESIIPTDNIPKIDSPSHDELLTPEESNHSTSTSDSCHIVSRKSILQKPNLVNGCMGEEKVYHGLGIRPYDEMIFERIDPLSQGTSDCVQTLQLTNMGDKILTFKIKTTSPDKFRVKPGCSLLHPGAKTTVSVYLLKAYCTPTNNINKEKFLIIWTLIGHELKQAQLIEFWKTVPNSVLYEHRLRCSLSNKPTSVTSINQSNEIHSLHSSISSDPSIVAMQNILKDSITLQKTTIAETARELKQIRYLLLIIFVLLFLVLLLDVHKYFFSFSSSSSSSSSSVKSDL
ncbi:unnamed protein product [Rotaria sordida]|uniref:Motile sperm domain-containing protein 2 n=1 Tax=Rotaria sordida TaxID=392033 RepID=A0A818NVH9_9BILA|nr:unnamed protein product [Rotaria sordida]